MTNNHAKMELLSPAGSEEAFAAALHNGADAIYLGAGPHHARQFAGGFSEASFFSLTEQAHTAGVKVYLTLNTLLAQGELDTASEWAEKAWSGGVDAIIVQDAGLVRLLHHRFPEMIDLNIHTEFIFGISWSYNTHRRLNNNRIIFSKRGLESILGY